MFIKSNLIQLSPVDETSINDNWIKTLNDHEYMKFSKNKLQFWSHGSQLNYLNQFDQFKSWCLKITNLEDESFVGTTTIYFDYLIGTVNLGFLIFKEFKGRNFASETLKLICNYISENFPNFRIEIGTHTSNLAMIKVIEKEGFRINECNSEDHVIKYYKITESLNELTIPRIPPILAWAKKICLVANDAGGAEKLKWLLKSIQSQPATLLEGPAVKIFEKSGLDYYKLETKEQLSFFDLVLAGSGWMSNFENSIINFCTQRKIPNIVVLDHWVNYKVRFQTLEISSPKLLAVDNSMALSLANQTFKNSTIWRLPDFQIMQYKEWIDGSLNRKKILVILEPDSKIKNANQIRQEVIFDLIKKTLILNTARNFDGLVIRLHPSQSHQDKEIINLKQHFKGLVFSVNSELIDDLNICSLVVGLNSYALYIAAMCGKETKSYFKSNTEHWTSSISEIGNL